MSDQIVTRAPTTDLHDHITADALHLLADLVAAGRVQATGTGSVWVEVDPDQAQTFAAVAPAASAYRVRDTDQCRYRTVCLLDALILRVAESRQVPELVAAALLTPDAPELPDGAS